MLDTIRETSPRPMARSLPCWGGPLDGTTALLEAGETTLERWDGRYVAVAVTRRGRTGEQLRWRDA